jgi:hypothetical protein
MVLENKAARLSRIMGAGEGGATTSTNWRQKISTAAHYRAVMHPEPAELYPPLNERTTGRNYQRPCKKPKSSMADVRSPSLMKFTQFRTDTRKNVRRRACPRPVVSRDSGDYAVKQQQSVLY